MEKTPRVCAYIFITRGVTQLSFRNTARVQRRLGNGTEWKRREIFLITFRSARIRAVRCVRVTRRLFNASYVYGVRDFSVVFT